MDKIIIPTIKQFGHYNHIIKHLGEGVLLQESRAMFNGANYKRLNPEQAERLIQKLLLKHSLPEMPWPRKEGTIW
jgi:hypothetical protein